MQAGDPVPPNDLLRYPDTNNTFMFGYFSVSSSANWPPCPAVGRAA
jgi:hypothetical protein